MADFGQFLQGASGGAGLGATIPGLGPYGAIAGGVIGGVTSLFGESPEDKRKRRKNELIQAIQSYRQNALREGSQTISKLTQGQVASARQAGARRAASMGAGDASAYIAPAETKAEVQGGRAIGDLTSRINEQTNQALLGVENDWADRPEEPGVSDYILGLGETALKIKSGLDKSKLENDYNSNSPEIADIAKATQTPTMSDTGIDYSKLPTNVSIDQNQSRGFRGLTQEDPYVAPFRKAFARPTPAFAR